jgi:hypothetical protein
VQKRTTFVPVLFVSDQHEPGCQAARDREAKQYWESLTPAQEGWIAQKMHFHEFGRRPVTKLAASDTPRSRDGHG